MTPPRQRLNSDSMLYLYPLICCSSTIRISHHPHHQFWVLQTRAHHMAASFPVHGTNQPYVKDARPPSTLPFPPPPIAENDTQAPQYPQLRLPLKTVLPCYLPYHVSNPKQAEVLYLYSPD